MTGLLHLGDVLAGHARVHGDRIGARDLDRAMSFREWNARACRLANALLGLGLAKGDRVAVLAYNCVEWLEIYAASAKAGIVAVPINFRLVAGEIRFIVENCGARALIVQDALTAPIEEVRGDLPIEAGRYIIIGAPVPGYLGYEALLARARDSEPGRAVAPADPWMLMYTSGTTGKPKGAIRSHGAGAMLSLVTAVELGFNVADSGLLAMPMCHANSLYFASTLITCGGAVGVYSRRSFDPEHFLRSFATGGESFTSLVPTQYIMMLELPAAVRDACDTQRVRKLMISSAPARPDTKRAIMDYFANAGLFELYGSTEAGWVTMLHPDEQFSKLGSVGRECVGTGPIRLIGEDGAEVADGEVGELYSRTPYVFDGYWGLPEKTREAFRGDYCTVNDMARRDADGYYWLVDRKSNMIISGGENIYPSEVEALLAGHPAVREAAVVGLPDAKWGERVHGVVVLAEGRAAGEAELLAWCRDRIAGYKRPRSISIIGKSEMPRTATGKVQHRVLKTRLTDSARG
ncbi:MAG: long-chain fatty acid--CoA ligase [Bradyrhizobiaceae bacterium]|nr:MAG: long-chain fatty acid--CoA ligase [Bradyrhizobiaceae bacterium]